MSILIAQIILGPWTSQAWGRPLETTAVDSLMPIPEKRTLDDQDRLAEIRTQLMYLGFSVGMMEQWKTGEEQILDVLYQVAKRSYEYLYRWHDKTFDHQIPTLDQLKKLKTSKKFWHFLT
ncbi:MAG: hypothetical protein R3A11_03300 [Bdellovibrionota bacterium]